MEINLLVSALIILLRDLCTDFGWITHTKLVRLDHSTPINRHAVIALHLSARPLLTNAWMTGNLRSMHQAKPAVQIALTEVVYASTASTTVPMPKKTVISASTQNVLNVRVT